MPLKSSAKPSQLMNLNKNYALEEIISLLLNSLDCFMCGGFDLGFSLMDSSYVYSRSVFSKRGLLGNHY